MGIHVTCFMLKGLSSEQVSRFLLKYGLNIISEQKKKSFLKKFLDQFNNFLTILLIGADILSFFIGESIDGGLILAIVILNGFFGLYQEAKAEESLAMLKKMTISKVRVIRDGVEQEIDSHYLVPGDIVFIEEGIKIPADGKIIELRSLEINESALTGESLPVVKKIDDEIFMGTIVAKGRGYVKITKTGMKSKFGEIALKLSQIEAVKTPLQKKLENLTKLIGIISILASIIVFILSAVEGSGYFPAFLLAISLAVAVVPEGLPAVMTITLAIGVKEMAKKKSIIRKLAAIEALGSVTLIATDKTGTLTTNKMQVKEVYFNNTKSEILNSKSQINPKFEIKNLKRLGFDHANLFEASNLDIRAFNLLLLDGIINSTASLVYIRDHGKWDVLGDPTEGALLFLGQKVGLNPELVRQEWKIIDEIPFDSVTKRMTVVVKNSESRIQNSELIFSKGAPESILSICDKQLINGKEEKFGLEEKEQVDKQVEEWGRKGLRVLGFAYKQTQSLKLKTQNHNSKLKDELTDNLPMKPFEDKLVFLGMVAIHDSPRPEANEAVKKAKQAGIKVVMITGDNEKTAESVGAHAGIINYGEEILVGSQVDQYSDKELLKILPRVKIFARTTPFHKHRIVKLFQELGEVVVVTGDGVNDAIALKQADVGVAMGLVGTDVARETADMVITDDNFASIVNAIEEGRNIVKNLKNAITYLLSCNVSEAAALIIALFLGFPGIFFPLQFLYINLITDGLPALILAFSPRSKGLMRQLPTKELSLINSFQRKYILLIGMISAIIVLGSYCFYTIYLYEEIGKTAAFSVLTMIQSFIFIDLWLSHRSLHLHLKQLVSPLFILAFIFPFITQYLILHFERVANLFRVSPISPLIYLQFVIISGLIMVGIKGVKIIIKKNT